MPAELLAIGQATEADLPAVRALMRRYVDWHRERHAAYRAMIDRYFDPVAFDAELDGLPGAFAPPSGRLLVAQVGTDAGGLRRLARPRRRGLRDEADVRRARAPGSRPRRRARPPLPRRGRRGRLSSGAPRHRPAAARGAPALRRARLPAYLALLRPRRGHGRIPDLHGARRPRPRPRNPASVGASRAEATAP